MSTAVLTLRASRVAHAAKTAAWVVGGLVTAACLLRIARNIRIADTKGTAQVIAVDEPVVRRVGGGVAWIAFVDVSRDEAVRRERACASMSGRVTSAVPVQLVLFRDTSVVSTSSSCAANSGVVVASLSRDEARRASSAMRDAALEFMLTTGDGRYVFGSDRIEDLSVTELFGAVR